MNEGTLTSGDGAYIADLEAEVDGLRTRLTAAQDELRKWKRLYDEHPHTRGTTSAGPDYCEECSAATQEWVRWPCPQVARPVVAYVYHGPNGDQVLDPQRVEIARATLAGSVTPIGDDDG